jgi:hypothetical protein
MYVIAKARMLHGIPGIGVAMLFWSRLLGEPSGYLTVSKALAVTMATLNEI